MQPILNVSGKSVSLHGAPFQLSAGRCIAWLRVLIWSCANSSTTSTKTSGNQVFKCISLGECLSFKSPQGSEYDQNTFYNIFKGLIKIFFKDAMTHVAPKHKPIKIQWLYKNKERFQRI